MRLHVICMYSGPRLVRAVCYIILCIDVAPLRAPILRIIYSYLFYILLLMCMFLYSVKINSNLKSIYII